MSNFISFIVSGAEIIDCEDMKFQDNSVFLHYKLKHPDISENFDVYIDKSKYAEATLFPVIGEKPRVLVKASNIWKNHEKTSDVRLSFKFKDF